MKKISLICLLFFIILIGYTCVPSHRCPTALVPRILHIDKRVKDPYIPNNWITMSWDLPSDVRRRAVEVMRLLCTYGGIYSKSSLTQHQWDLVNTGISMHYDIFFSYGGVLSYSKLIAIPNSFILYEMLDELEKNKNTLSDIIKNTQEKYSVFTINL